MSERTPTDRGVSWLERLTGIMLMLVLTAIGWMMAVTLWPSLPHPMSLDVEVVVMVVLLVTSLLLVSAVALFHTR